MVGPLSIVGGTIKGNGTVLYTPPPAGSPAGTLGTATLQAINGTAEEPGLTFEFGEHLLIGPFDFEGPVGNPTRMLVNGQEFRMNDDPRMPLYPADGTLMDIGGEPITIADLAQAQFRGTLIAVGGYFAKDATGRDILWGTSVETEAFAFNPNGDTIAIERAEYRTSNRLLRVEGSVLSPDGTSRRWSGCSRARQPAPHALEPCCRERPRSVRWTARSATGSCSRSPSSRWRA